MRCFAGIAVIAVFILGLGGLFGSAAGQGMVNINVTGIPSVVDAPFTDQFEQNFRNGRYQLVFTYNNNNSVAVDFRFKFRVTKGGDEILEVTSEPESFRPGAYVFTSVFDELPFPQSFNKTMEQVDSRLKQQVLQEGTIPEGNYVLYVEAVPEEGAGMISSPQSMTPFMVRYPQPPMLINPSNESNLTLETPVFNWTSLQGLRQYAVQYDFLLVEVLESQTPLQALNSNRAHARQSVIDQNTLIYTPEYLPLEEGSEYAWQVTANTVDGTLPIKNDGQSEFQTFTYKKDAGDELISDIRQLDQVPLVPEFARLVNLGQLEVTEAADSYVLNGRATLELNFINSEAGQLRVQVDNLRLQKQSLSNPVLMGGSLRGDAGQVASIPGNSSELTELDEIIWRFGEGVTATATLSDYSGQSYRAQGTLNLTATRASGTVRASGEPLFTVNEDLAEIEITEMTAAFPEGTVSGKGALRVFGQDTGCEINNFAFLDDRISTMFRCETPFAVPLARASDAVSLDVNRISGTVDARPQDDELDYHLKLDATAGLLTEGGETCGTDAIITADSETGLAIIPGQRKCSAVQPRIDLGFIQLELTQTELEHLSYDPANQDWDFELLLGAKVEIPAFDAWKSTELEDIRVDNEGIHFNKYAFEDGPFSLPEYDIHDYRVRLQSLLMREFTFPLFEWDKTGPGPWELAFSGEVSVPNDSRYPECIRGETMELTGGHVQDMLVFGEVGVNSFSGCSADFGTGHALNIDELSGRFGVEYHEDDSFEPIGRLDLGGSISLGRPFTCDTGDSTPLGEQKFSFTTGFNGTLENVIPGCDVAIGPFTARVTDSDITFSHTPGADREATMQASAELELPGGQRVQGSFGLNLLTGEFESVSFNINDPFEWQIPGEDPVLTFLVNSARIDENGFLIDGRQQFLLESGTRIGTTFDNLLIDLETLRLTGGRVIFDESFGMIAGIDAGTQSLNFRAVDADTALTEDPGLFMELGGQVTLDSAGVHATGTANAAVIFDGRQYDELATVEFSDEFAFQLYPFKVGSGRADFMVDGSRFAYADPDGFHPVPGFFADMIIPDLLPLPTEDIAYLRLREGDSLLVDAVENSEGNYVLSTKPNTPLSLVAPFLNNANPPVLSNITLDNVVISADPTNPEVLEGAIIADVPVGDPNLQMKNRNVPLTLRQLYFGSRVVDGSPLTALYLLGDLHLFESDLPHDQQAAFYIQSDGALQASLNLSGMGAQVPLLPGGQAMLMVDAVSGTFSLQEGATSPAYDLDLTGGLEIDTESGFSTGADIGIRLTPGTFNVTNFVPDDFGADAELDFGVFGLQLDSIESLPQFGYTRANGFEFAIALDAGLRIQPATGDEFVFPLLGLELRNTGIHLPPQDIDESSIPGLDLPAISLAGFSFKPLGFETASTFTFDWSQGVAFNPDVSMDFEVELPEFEGTGLNPPDGLTFTGVSMDDGFFTGSVAPFQPLGGAEIPLIGGMPDSPTLMISEIFGSLSRDQDQQLVDIRVDAELGNLPAFTGDDPDACVEDPSFTLALVESKYFEGTISGVQPCGYVEIGPAKLSVSTADLIFSVSANSQRAELDGGVDLTLPAPNDGSPITASGLLTLDLITGEISGGSVDITQPFALNLPFASDDPMLNFTVNQATLDANGLSIQGGGNLTSDGVQANVQFNNLLMGFDPFVVEGGSATIDSDFAAEIGLSPFSFSLVDTTSQLPADNAIRMDLNADMELNPAGLTFSGTSIATILFSGQEYASLRAELVNGFTLNVGGFSVNSGSAEFYDDSDQGQAVDPLAILDDSGFNLGSQVLALLPSRIPLPTEDIAYVDIKDQNDSLLVDLTSNQSGGYTISTNGQPLPVVIPALPDQSDNPTEVNVEFSLTTDDAYHITGGALTLQSETSLASSLDLPLSLRELEITDDGNGPELKAGLALELPGVLQEHEALVNATINSGGIESGSVSLGDYRTSYQGGLTPLYTYSHSGSVSGSNESDVFEASLLGVEATFGSSNSVALSGTLSSSLIMDLNAGDEPVFFNASWSSAGWDFYLDPGNTIREMTMGAVTLSPNAHDGIGLETDEDSFYLVLNGTVSLEDVLGEPLDVSVQDLEVGVNDWSSSPSLHFALGQSVGTLADQQFTLFEGALSGNIIAPSVTITGRAVALSSSSGTLTFLEKDIDYQNLVIDTDGQFDFGQIQSDAITLIDDHLVINSMTLSNSAGLRLDTELAITLPAPVDQTSTSTISIYRDGQGQVQVEASEPAFSLDEEFALGDFGHFKLTQVAADIDPYDWQQSGVYANGELYEADEVDPIIYFGESGNFPNNPGLGFSPGQLPMVQYNATGNVSFAFDFSFFSVNIAFDQIASTQDGFEITLNGQADINLDQMSANLGYSGFTVSHNGVEDVGNLDGSGSIDMEGIGTLTIGQFLYESTPNGKEITMADASPKSPDELDGGAQDVQTTTKNVVELLCFGPCPADTGSQSANPALELSISANANSESGGFTGGVHSIYFYETVGGERELYIEDFNVSIDDFFTMNASLNYLQDGNDFLLRAAATGTFDIGGSTAGAAVAGKFANIDGETSYGLFVAVQADVGIPIVPGIIDLNGAGGGFFWKPDQADLDLVSTAIGGFGHELVNENAMPAADDVDFAVMLYADIGIAGSGNQYVVEGQTFFQITNQGFYMDARGNVLQMDGEGTASALVQGEMYISMQRDPFYILGDIGIALEVPGTVSGEGNIEYFLRETDDEVVWGIIGNAEFGILGDMLEGDGEFLAAQQGFLLEVGVGFNVGVPLISVKSDVTGSVWLLDDPDFSLPFGAYVVFSAEACLGVCITADAKGAFVTKSPSGFEIYAAVKGCVDLLVDEACVSAWASVADNGIDAGFGKGSHNDLIAQAQDQRDRFRQKIEDMKNQIAAAKAALQEPPGFAGLGVSTSDVRDAGRNFYSQSKAVRDIAVTRILNDVETSPYGSSSRSYSPPSQLQQMMNTVMKADRTHNGLVEYILSPEDSRFVLVNYFADVEDMSDDVTGLLDEGLQTSIEYREMAESAFDSMMTTMTQSPVSNVYKPVPSANVSESPSFRVDETVASEQAQSTEELRNQIEEMDNQFRASIADVEASLQEMHSLLDTRVEGSIAENNLTVTPGVNRLTQEYAHVIRLLQEYYAMEANKHWLEWDWASNLHSTVQQQSGQIQSGIQQLNNGFNSALANRNSNTNAYMNEVYRTVQRAHAISRFKDSTFTSSIPAVNDPYVAPQEMLTVFNELENPSCTDGSLDCVRDSVAVMNNRFWYDMHDLGLQDYTNQTSRRVINDVVPAHSQLENSLLDPLKQVTDLADQFYSNKANLTSILYNMIDNYLGWRQSVEVVTEGAVQDTTSSVDYQQRLQGLSDELVPPQITGITADPERPSYSGVNTFFNETDISWNATHPAGIVENSIDVKEFEEDTDISVGYHDYLSVGSNTSITQYPYKRTHPRGSNPSPAELQMSNTRRMNVGVRVRGLAGNTAIRRATFYVDVGPGGQSVSPGSSVLSNSVSSPDRPVLWLSSFYEKNTTTRYQQVTTQTQFGPINMTAPVEVDEYWTNEPTAIDLHIQAHDPESGIATYEYAVGSSKGGTDVIAWTELQGTRNFLSYVPTSEMIGQTRMINMTPGQEYYVSVRVTNGAGMTSRVMESSTPVIYDGEAPGKPGLAYVAVPMQQMSYAMGYSTPVDPVLESVPALDTDPELLNDWTYSATPEIERSWTASSDDQSGVSHYEYVVSTSEEVPLEDFEDVRVKTTEGTHLEYSGDLPGSLLEDFETGIYIHVRAKDYAGNASEVRTLGPNIAKDPTSPVGGKMQAKVDPFDVKLYLVELPYDPETDLEGIQYALGTSPGATDLRSWPDGSNVDFAWSSEQNGELYWSGISHTNQERFVSIPRSQLPEGDTFYISYRVVNGVGKKSGTRATGPINLDGSRPLTPSIDLSYNQSNSELQIDLENLEDPESGIASVEYSVRYLSWNTLVGWTDMHEHAGNKQGSFDLSGSVSLSGDQVDDPTYITVHVRITNGAGLQRTAQKSVTFSDMYQNLIQAVQQQYNGFLITY
ncbi:hypothetical protein ACG2F4_10705 [Halalkalibaculum sp. DA3122]|uniref:hypothetical protein n=1 Tax=Halalkalibaculum sp. DA3122 TaxID=3373607 RepID=UPI003753E8F7